MMKKELGLFLLLAVISAITGAVNPAYLSLVNLLNMANLIGLFGVFALGEGLVIITGGIDLSLGSMLALLGVVFVDACGSAADAGAVHEVGDRPEHPLGLLEQPHDVGLVGHVGRQGDRTEDTNAVHHCLDGTDGQRNTS